MTITAPGNRMTTDIARQAKLARAVADTQASISTGKRLRAASQEPLAAARVAQLSRAQSDDATWKGNLTLAAALAGQADTSIAALSERMTTARELMLAGASGTASASDRATIAASLRGVGDDVAQIAATKSSLGGPLFAATTMRVDATTVIAPVADSRAVFARGGVSFVDDLTEAAAALESGDGMRIDAAISRLGGAIEHVADSAAAQGIRAARIDRLLDSNAARAIDMAAERSSLEDTDLMAAIATLNAQQLTLEAAQSAFARINRRSLFDILG